MNTNLRPTPYDAVKARSPEEVAAAIRAATASNVRGAVAGLISGYHPMDIAYAMRELDAEEREAVFELLDADDAGVVLEEVDDEIGADLAEATSDKELAEIIDAMPPDVGSDVVGLLDEERQHRVLEHIPAEEARELRELLQFEDDTAGGLMTTDLLMAPGDLTAGELIAHLRNQNIPADTLTYVYVIDEQRRLLGVIGMPELVIADPRALLGDVMVTDVVSVGPHTDQEEVAQLVDKYDLLGLPVVDEHNRLLGMVTVDDVIDALQEEHSEDVSRFAGTSAETLASVSSLRVARLRLPWLIICLFGTFVSALVIRLFEGSLKEAIGLAAFIPVIAAMSGNSGLQTATIVVRGMALGVVRRESLGRLLARETITALVIGGCCGVIAGAAGWVITNHWGFGPVVAVAMTLAIMWSTTVGTIIPFIFQVVGIDPALSSGPLVTTLNDSFSLLIYFAVAVTMMALIPGLLG